MSEQTYELRVNGEAFHVSMKELFGLQVRALAAIDPVYDLIVEGEGSAPDRILRDNDKLPLSSRPVRIFTRPPTTFGLMDAI